MSFSGRAFVPLWGRGKNFYRSPETFYVFGGFQNFGFTFLTLLRNWIFIWKNQKTNDILRKNQLGKFDKNPKINHILRKTTWNMSAFEKNWRSSLPWDWPRVAKWTGNDWEGMFNYKDWINIAQTSLSQVYDILFSLIHVSQYLIIINSVHL